jgi:hypothetical protein
MIIHDFDHSHIAADLYVGNTNCVLIGRNVIFSLRRNIGDISVQLRLLCKPSFFDWLLLEDGCPD